MGFFGKRDVASELEKRGFHVTATLFDPPALSMLPSIYQDLPARMWAVRYPGAEPVTFSFDDILECEIVEAKPRGDAGEGQSGSALLQQILSNPARVSRENAARKGSVCLGLGVVVAVRTPAGEISQLQIPVLTREMKRDTRAFAQMRELAERIKAEFDGMVAQQGEGADNAAES